MGKLEQDCQYWSEQIVKDRARLADLVARGTDALSDYDKRIAYGGNVEYALLDAKRLKQSHIDYGTKQLERCPKPLIEMTPTNEITLAPAEPKQPKKPAPEPLLKQGVLF